MGDKPVMITGGLLVYAGWGLVRYKYLIDVVKTNNYFDAGYEFLCISFLALLLALFIGMVHKNGYR